MSISPDAGTAVCHAVEEKFGPENVRYDRYAEKEQGYEFPVFSTDNSTVSSTSRSQVLGSMPLASVDCVFVDRRLVKEVTGWLEKQKASIIRPEVENQ